MLSQSVEICQWMEVPAKEVKLKTTDDVEVEVKPPSVHVGYKPIKLLLISYKWRGSQVCPFVKCVVVPHCVWCVQPYGRATKKTPCALSPGLVVHLHGGGYVAQSPQSHMVSV